MVKFNIVEDLASLTNIDESILVKIFNKLTNYCLSDYINECFLSGNNTVLIDFGFGKLAINIEEDSIKYKFIPSEELELNLINSLNNKNQLEVELSNSLSDKLLANYKDLF